MSWNARFVMIRLTYLDMLQSKWLQSRCLRKSLVRSC